jgi:hypothetical protein
LVAIEVKPREYNRGARAAKPGYVVCMAICGGPPRLQRRAMELHDSKLLGFELHGRDLVARFEAYVHVSLGVPGTDRGTGWSQELRLLVRNAQISEQPRELPLWIVDGAVVISGEALRLLPVPLEATKGVRLAFGGIAGNLAVSGDGLSLTALGDARFVERFEGA